MILYYSIIFKLYDSYINLFDNESRNSTKKKKFIISTIYLTLEIRHSQQIFVRT